MSTGGRKAAVGRRQLREGPALREVLKAAAMDFFPAEETDPDLSACADPWRSSVEQVLREILLPAAREGWIPEGEREIAAWARGEDLRAVRERGAGVLRANPWPPGFHLPTVAEFVSSERYLGGLDGRPPLSDRQRHAVEASIGPSAREWYVEPRQTNLVVLVYGKGCLGADERLTDHRSGEIKTMREWAEDGRPLLLESWDGEKRVLIESSPVTHRGRGPMCNVTLKNGVRFRCSYTHQLLTETNGWRTATELAPPSRYDRVKMYETAWYLKPKDWEYVAHVSSDTWRTWQPEPAGRGPENDWYSPTVPGTECYFDAQGVLHHNSGKNLFGSELLSYNCYVVANMRNPWFHFNVAQGDVLDCLNVAQNADAAKDNFFERVLFNLRRPCFASLLDEDDFKTSSVSFRKRIPGSAFPVELLRLRSMHSGAKNVEGRNTFFFIMDEADEFYDATGHDKARNMLANLTTSSRGVQIGFVVSYPRSEVGIMFELLDQCGNRTNDEGVPGGRPDYWGDLAETGEVLPQKCWVPDETDSEGSPLPGTLWRNPLSGWASDAPGAIVDRVMHGVWAYDQALFDARYRCRPSGAAGAWLAYPHLVDDAVRVDLTPAGIWTPRVSTRTDAETGTVREHAALDLSELVLRPGASYWGGLDIGLDDDSACFCLSHAVPPNERGFLCPTHYAERKARFRKHYGAEPLPVDRSGLPLLGEGGEPLFPDLLGWRPVAWRCDECGAVPRPGADEFWGVCWPTGKRVTVPVVGEDGEASSFREEWLPLVVEDLLLEWRPDPRNRRPVDLIDVKEKIAQIRRAGRLVKVNADSWQAELMAQELNRSGMSVETVKISSGYWLRVYGVYKTLLTNGLVELLPDQDRRARQLKELIRRPNGVPDHPEFSRGGGKGRKDLTDAEAMSFFLAATMGRQAARARGRREDPPEARREREAALDTEGRKRLNSRRSFVQQVLSESESVKGRLR